MIISASYRTDIPAFYGRWFMKRLQEGVCTVENPWNRRTYTVDLTAETVDGFVFWTRNLRPFITHLSVIKSRAPFVVQYTVTNYPRILDAGTPSAEHAVDDIRKIARQYGQSAVVWRYDPIVISSLTPFEWHIRNFGTLSRRLAGAVDEVIVSFAHFYRKTKRNLVHAAAEHSFSFEDPTPFQKHALMDELSKISTAYGMKLCVCSQPENVVDNVGVASCIDANRLSRVGNGNTSAPVKGNRPGCMCHASRDIGAYNTCPHGCVYCYAVDNRYQTKIRHREHDHAGTSLVGNARGNRQ